MLLVTATVLAYQPVWHTGFIWDDDFYVKNNWTLHDFNGLKHIWLDTKATPQYYPLVHTTFWLEYHAWKLTPAGYHVVNVLLHALGSILLWRLLKRLELPGAWLAAAIFALHPVNVESVAWITERKNVLSLVFFCAAAWAYLRFVGESESKNRRRGWWFAALLLFVCALLSKTVACSLPAVLLLERWWKKNRLERGDVLPLVPFFIVGLWMGLQTAWLEKHHVGASGAEWSFSIVERGLIAGRALWFYAGKLVWPVNLTFVYPRWQLDAGVWWQWLFPVAALAMVATLWFARKRIGRGLLAAVLFFAVTLFPALGFFDVYPFRYSFVADHFQYLASLGPLALAAAGIEFGLGRMANQSAFPRVLFCAVLLTTLGALTWHQCGMYADEETLWRTTLARNPGCWMAHDNLGLLYLKTGKVDKSVAEFRETLEIKPDFVEARNDLGNALAAKGDLEQAVAQYRKALEIRPDFAHTHYDLANVLFDQGHLDQAIAHYQKALEAEPGLVEAHFNLGNALLNSGRFDEAVAQYKKVLELQPAYGGAFNNLGTAYTQLGRVSEAMGAYRKALDLQPENTDALNNLAWALATCPQAALRDGAAALALAKKGVQLTGDKNPLLLRTLAAAYAETGSYGMAAVTARPALELAVAQKNDALAAALQKEIKLYEADTPVRESAMDRSQMARPREAPQRGEPSARDVTQ